MIYVGGEKNESRARQSKKKYVQDYYGLFYRNLGVKGKSFNINIVVVYAPETQITEKEIENLYCTLVKTKAKSKSQEVTFVMRVLNTKVGKEQDGEMAGQLVQGTCNECGGKWVKWCIANDKVVVNN